MDPAAVIDTPVADVVDDDDGDIASLLDSLMDDDSAAGSDEEEATEDEAQPEEQDGDTPAPEADEEPAAPTGGENPELERIRLENEQHRQFQTQLRTSLEQKQLEEQRQLEQKKLTDRFEKLDDIDDPDIRARERGAILQDVRNQERNVFLPRINALEQEKETSAQGIVALHYALESFLTDLKAGEIDLEKAAPDALLKQIQDAAVAYMEFESPADMQREIAARNQLKAQLSERNRALLEENQKMRKALTAMKKAGKLPVGGGTGRGNSATPVTSKSNKDDGSIHWLIDSLDTPMDDEATGTDY